MIEALIGWLQRLSPLQLMIVALSVAFFVMLGIFSIAGLILFFSSPQM